MSTLVGDPAGTPAACDVQLAGAGVIELQVLLVASCTSMLEGCPANGKG